MKIWLPCLLLALFIPFSPELDRAASDFFFYPNQAFSSATFFRLLYKFGQIPANLTGIGALFLYLLSLFYKKYKPLRCACLVLVLSLILGPGLLVNTALKHHWGRPRPVQTVEYGGKASFRPLYSPCISSSTTHLRSFPSGHASSGFFFFAFVFIGLREKKRALVILGYTLAFGLGLLLSLSRIASGAHFLSDCLVSMFLMWFVPMLISYFIYPRKAA